MALGDKPTSLPEWADGGSAEIDEPLLAAKQLGYVDAMVPDAGNLNWYMNLVYLWAAYLNNFENVNHNWLGTQEIDGTLSITNDLQLQTGAGISALAGSVSTVNHTALIHFLGGAGVVVAEKFSSGAASQYDDGSVLNIGHGSGATATTILDVLEGGVVKLEDTIGSWGGTRIQLQPSTGTRIPAKLDLHNVGDSAFGHVPFIEFGANNQMQLDPGYGIPLAYAGFQVGDGSFYAGVGFTTPGTVTAANVTASGNVSATGVSSANSMSANPALGYAFSSNRTSYRVTQVGEMNGYCGSAGGTAVHLGAASGQHYFGGAQFTTNGGALSIPIHAPAGATISAIKLNIANGTGVSLSGSNLKAKVVVMTVGDDTSNFTQSYANTSGSGGDSIVVASGSAQQWYAIPIASPFVVPSNGMVFVELDIAASLTLSDLLAFYSARAKFTWTKIDAAS